MPTQKISVAGNFRVPVPSNDPSRDVAPGSQEFKNDLAKIAEEPSSVRELPHVIDGERIFGGEATDLVALHRPSQVLGRLPRADDAGSPTYASAILDINCDEGAETGECFYCTGPETD